MDEELAPSGQTTSQEDVRSERIHRLQNAARFTAMTGIFYAVLFIVSFWLLTDAPNAKSTYQEFVDYYDSEKSNSVTLVALYLMPFSGIAFLWFIVLLRMWISNRVARPVSVLFSNIQLMSGVVFLALFFASAAALSVTAIAVNTGDQSVSPATAMDFMQFGGTMFYVFATRMGAMFVFTTTNIGRANQILPTWFVLVGIAVGFTMLLSASFNRALILVFPLWVLILCVLILIHAQQVATNRIELESDKVDELAHAPIGEIDGAGTVVPNVIKGAIS